MLKPFGSDEFIRRVYPQTVTFIVKRWKIDDISGPVEGSPEDYGQ